MFSVQGRASRACRAVWTNSIFFYTYSITRSSLIATMPRFPGANYNNPPPPEQNTFQSEEPTNDCNVEDNAGWPCTGTAERDDGSLYSFTGKCINKTCKVNDTELPYVRTPKKHENI